MQKQGRRPMVRPGFNEERVNEAFRKVSSGSVGSHVKVELMKAGVVSQTISASTPNDGMFTNWTIPSTLASGTDTGSGLPVPPIPGLRTRAIITLPLLQQQHLLLLLLQYPDSDNPCPNAAKCTRAIITSLFLLQQQHTSSCSYHGYHTE